MKNRQKEHYSTLKMVLRITTLLLSIWALVIAYQAKSIAEWVNSKQNNLIERVLFP